MRRLAEFMGFGGGALALHLFALVGFQSTSEGAAASGANGLEMISLEASTSAVADMVADWERPPEIAEPVTIAMPHAPSMTAPDLNIPTTTPAPVSAMPTLAVPNIDRPALPTIQPPPQQVVESEIAPVISARPVQRPARRTPAPERTTRKRNTPDTAAQRAAGQGNGANAGTSQSGQVASLSAADRQSLMAQWGGVIRSRIERRKSYPRSAGRASGTVRVTIRVGTDGKLQALGVAASSGNAALDEAALTAVRRAGRFPSAPSGITGAAHSFTLPMSFSR